MVWGKVGCTRESRSLQHSRLSFKYSRKTNKQENQTPFQGGGRKVANASFSLDSSKMPVSPDGVGRERVHLMCFSSSH